MPASVLRPPDFRSDRRYPVIMEVYGGAWAEALLGMPRTNAAEYDSASVLLRAANLHGRLLLVHGSHDDNVHPQNEQALIDALVRGGKTFDYMVYPMRQHEIGDRAARRHPYETMIELWERNLGSLR